MPERFGEDERVRPPSGRWDRPDGRFRLLGVLAIVVHHDTTAPETPGGRVMSGAGISTL
ncbi:hypothetical protein HMPREF3223_00886 [Cutibacterium avidum]|uniref:Uncharacterized protein n=1 Tax=Cutibacterium avidum ATCC 25577 TaxID=997355 RepID=G4CYF3_9ACTN|nr:hypothetical protein HMPREF9153_1560 [Cutibacterium avidum ATCC 25577]KXA68553.1 hypothetical protein HMPREF3223_00886 [Cutibacterium avidum]